LTTHKTETSFYNIADFHIIPTNHIKTMEC